MMRFVELYTSSQFTNVTSLIVFTQYSGALTFFSLEMYRYFLATNEFNNLKSDKDFMAKNKVVILHVSNIKCFSYL